jgi:hypothetical protein
MQALVSEDDPEKGSKHVVLPLTHIKTNVGTVMYILFYCVSKSCYVD